MTSDSSRDDESREDRNRTRALYTVMLAPFAALVFLPEVRLFGVSIPLMVSGAVSVAGFVYTGT